LNISIKFVAEGKALQVVGYGNCLLSSRESSRVLKEGEEE